jgi:hypothetical protein
MWHGRVHWLITDVYPRRIHCFLMGHDERMGNSLNYEPDYCDRCLVDWPQDRATVPELLRRCFVWCYERNWRWLVRLDVWLWNNHRNRLPTWWEY